VNAGTNYNVKPYVDDGSPLPAVGTRVSGLVDSAVIEGQVISVSIPNRTVVFTGFQASVPEANAGSTAPRSWSYTTLTNATMGWQLLQSTTANSSNFYFAKAGS
jgi:hypothetical protein